MSTARNLAALLDSSGDVVAGALDNAGGGGGAMEFISTQTITTAVASIDFESFGTHERIVIMYEGLYGSSEGDVVVQLKINGAYKTSAYLARRQTHNTSNTTTQGYSGLRKGIPLGYVQDGATYPSSGTIEMGHITGTRNKTVLCRGINWGYQWEPQFFTSGGVSQGGNTADQQSVLQGIRIIPDSGNIAGGTFTLYGIKTS